jgi:hypothetical protein
MKKKDEQRKPYKKKGDEPRCSQRVKSVASHKNVTHDIRNFWVALGKQRGIDRDEQ